MAKFIEVQRLIEAGFTDRQIARSLHCRRALVAQVRRGELSQEALKRAKLGGGKAPPCWALNMDWDAIERDIRGGFQVKRIWEEMAAEATSHANFFKYVKTRFAHLLQQTVTLREFRPGEYCEVDYAGDTIAWVDPQTAEVHRAHVFLGVLCFSQKIFAVAHENEQKPNWLDAHRRMFEFYGGSCRVLVPDQLKNAVIKSHRYDPDTNPDYVDLAQHYGVAVVPARARRPRDKALVESAVGILMRYFFFIHRRHTFTSLAEINQALSEAVRRINAKVHTRFKVSRDERFDTLERATLQALPLSPYVLGEWKTSVVHPDCTVAVDGNFYSAPHAFRGKEIRIKASPTSVEMFLDLDRIAIHARANGKVGERIVDNMHLPENVRAYREATPQMILAQARFSHPDLHTLIEEMFADDTLGNLRRAQGLVRKAFSTIQAHGRDCATPWITAAVAQLRRHGRIRVNIFEELVQNEKKKIVVAKDDRTIVRQPGNPMVRSREPGTQRGDGHSASAHLKLVNP